VNKKALILGASSDVATEIAILLLKKNYSLQLSCRNSISLKRKFESLSLTTKNIIFNDLDLLDYDSFNAFLSNIETFPDLIIFCAGYLPDEENIGEDEIKKTLRTNFEGPVILLNKISRILSHRKSGTLVGISSIAGIRGRGSNNIYGSSKAGFMNYLSGLRNKLNKNNINVITVIPGFIDTKMLKKSTPSFLTSSAKKAAYLIVKGIEDNKEIIYVSKIWFYIAKILNILPEKIFKKINF
jgi:short-subunit dehydrogenase